MINKETLPERRRKSALQQGFEPIKEVPRDFFDRLLHFLKHRKKFQKVVFLYAKGNPDGSLSHYPSLRDFRPKGF